MNKREEWLTSLKVGDPVVVDWGFRNKDEPGGEERSDRTGRYQLQTVLEIDEWRFLVGDKENGGMLSNRWNNLCYSRESGAYLGFPDGKLRGFPRRSACIWPLEGEPYERAERYELLVNLGWTEDYRGKRLDLPTLREIARLRNGSDSP